MRSDPEATEPPSFLRLAGDPVRWRLLRELAHSDQRVGELTGRVGQPQNLVSYHLGKLRTGGLVRSRRSSADGRDTYYRLNVARCAELLVDTGSSLHPGLQLDRAATSGTVTGRALFLCTGNSARSQMAEALLRQRAPGVEAVSAGSRPKPLHPNAVTVMGEYGLDLSGSRTKHLNEFAGQPFDYVISLCDRVREVCPEFPGHPDLIHWSMADPSTTGDTDAATYPAFQRAAEDLSDRIEFFLRVLARS